MHSVLEKIITRSNVALRRVLASIIAVKKQYYVLCVCVCRLRYPALNAHALYCHLWHVRLHNIFPYYLINDTKFIKKTSLGAKCVY
jgi:hypothetical protein